MPKKVEVPITAWSYSRLSAYRQCPLKFKLVNIEKLYEPKGPAMERGIIIHGDAEEYLNGSLKTVPKSLKLFEKDFKDLRKNGAIPEEQWALTDEFIETGWFGQDVWVRVKVDCYLIIKDGIIFVIDFKTGKIRPGYGEQLDLYALASMCLFDDVDEIHTQLWYLDQGIKVGANCKTKDNTTGERSGIYRPNVHLAKLKRYFKKETKAMLSDTRFAPKANQYCYNCHFRKDNGGPCKY